MKRGRLPLTALRSFEAAGRLKSFTAAAEELFVSQAAISRQVRELEELVGRALFDRLHRAVALTPEGERLLDVLTTGFDSIDAVLAAIAGTKGRTLTISSEPTFAALSLVPRLADFRLRHPDIELTVESDFRLIEFRARDAELAIRHSMTASQWPRTEATRLVDVEMIPVAATSLIANGPVIVQAGDLLQYTLLHEENRSLWGRWLSLASVPWEEAERGPVFADGTLVMQAVRRGLGIGLCDRLSAEEDIDAGNLVAPLDLALPLGAYYLVARDFAKLSPAARAFVDWIEAQFGVS